MLPKPLLWSLRVLAVALFAGALGWQVVRKQREGNAQAKVKADTPAPEKNTQFLSGSKSFTGSVAIPSGTLVAEDHPTWHAITNRQAQVIGTRLIMPSETAPAPAQKLSPIGPIIRGTKSGGVIDPDEAKAPSWWTVPNQPNPFKP